MATKRASQSHAIVIGSAGLSNQDIRLGYEATICVVIDPSHSTRPGVEFQDLHVTIAQLRDLRAAIDNHLDLVEKRVISAGL